MTDVNKRLALSPDDFEALSFDMRRLLFLMRFGHRESYMPKTAADQAACQALKDLHMMTCYTANNYWLNFDVVIQADKWLRAKYVYIENDPEPPVTGMLYPPAAEAPDAGDFNEIALDESGGGGIPNS